MSDETIVVRVEDVLHGVEMLHDFTGQAITVKLSSGQEVTEQQEYIFHTNGWLFGASIAVVAVAIEPAGDESAQQLRGRRSARPLPSGPRRGRRTPTWSIAGQVTQVTQVPRPPGAPISEHEPEWQEAVVRVHHVARGGRGGRPGSCHHPVRGQPGRPLGQGAEVRRRTGRAVDARRQDARKAARCAPRAGVPKDRVPRDRARGLLSEGSGRPRPLADRIGRRRSWSKSSTSSPSR